MTPAQNEHGYPLNNSEEVIRLQNQHEVIKDSMGRLVLAPINFSALPLQILDSGTADGTWIRDLERSTAPVGHKFYGVDINPDRFPADADVPPNTTYRVQDIIKRWPEDWKNQFDLVHQRVVLAAAGSKHQEVVKSLGDLVKPGGWIQLTEATNEVPQGCGPNMRAFVQLSRDVFQYLQTDVDITQRIPEWLERHGFIGIEYFDANVMIGARNPDLALARMGVFSMGIAAKGLSDLGKGK